MTAITNVYQATVTMTGTTGLVLDNIEAMDPDGDIAREIKRITGKDEMTDEDRARKDRLAYQGSLYLDDTNRLVLPYRCIKRALRSGAYLVGSTALAGRMDKGIETSALEFPLDYEGPQDPVKLYEDKRFRLRLMVNKNPTGKKAMVPSVRPLLPEWALTCTITVFNEVIGWDKFVQSVEATGLMVGVGNARKIGYGRFSASVEQA
jgi:hypothetical protein